MTTCVIQHSRKRKMNLLKSKKGGKGAHEGKRWVLFPKTKEEDAERKMSREVRNHVRLGRYPQAFKQLLPWAMRDAESKQELCGLVVGCVKDDSLVSGGSKQWVS